GLAGIRPQPVEHWASEMEELLALAPLQGEFGESRPEGNAAGGPLEEPSGDKGGNDLICRRAGNPEAAANLHNACDRSGTVQVVEDRNGARDTGRARGGIGAVQSIAGRWLP